MPTGDVCAYGPIVSTADSFLDDDSSLDGFSLDDVDRAAARLDGIARHTQEGLDFVRRAERVGFRDAVRERDDPFEDYGSRKR